MRLKFFNLWEQAKLHPQAALNISLILLALLLAFGYYIYLNVKTIDVLKDWSVEITQVEEYRQVNVNGTTMNLPVYNPGDTLLFTSTSTKVTAANGVTNRMIVCITTEQYEEKEIQLDTLPAVRPQGVNPKRDNAIFIPDVTQFGGLPRICKLVFDIGYEDVVLDRDWNEHAETGLFVVEEEELTAKEARELINELTEKIERLEAVAASPTIAAQPAPSTTVFVTPEQERKPANAANGNGRQNQQQEQEVERIPQPNIFESIIGLITGA